MEFYSEKCKYRCRNDTLDDARATPYPKMPPSETVNAYGVSQYEVQPSSLDLPLVNALNITERKKRTTYRQLDQQGKA
jgi:hypothetical protein